MNEKAATLLSNLYATYMEQDRPKAKEVAVKKFSGACEGIHAMGVGMTPAMVEMWVIDAWRHVGPRPAFTANNQDRKTWVALMVTTIIAAASNDGYRAVAV